MSGTDANNSLPVRTEANGDVAVKIVDGSITSQALAIDATGKPTIKLNDGNGNAITSQVSGAQQALDVGINVGGIQVDPRAVRALTSADVVTANQGSANTIVNGWPVNPTDGTNSQGYTASSEAKISVTQPLPAGTNIIGKVSQDTNPWITSDLADGSVTGGTVATKSLLAGAQYNSSAPTLTTAQQAALQSDVNANLKVNVAVALPIGTNNIGKVSVQDSTGAAITSLNPLPVIISAAVPGTQINNYNVSATNVAVAGNDTHIYTITATKTFIGKKFVMSASGKARFDIASSPDGSTYTTLFTAFISVSSPTIQIDMGELAITDSGTGSTIKITRTNEDKQAFAMYSTISGIEQ